MQPILWQGRTCKVEDGIWMLSAVDDPDNWDFAPIPFGPKSAVAGWFPNADVLSLALEDKSDNLLIVATDGLYRIVGNPADGGRIELVSR